MNPENENIYRSRDVIFREDQTIEDFDKSIWRKVVSEWVEWYVTIANEHHADGDANIPHKQVNERNENDGQHE